MCQRKRRKRKRSPYSQRRHSQAPSPLFPLVKFDLTTFADRSQVLLVPSLFKHRPATVWFAYCGKYGERTLDAELVRMSFSLLSGYRGLFELYTVGGFGCCTFPHFSFLSYNDTSFPQCFPLTAKKQDLIYKMEYNVNCVGNAFK